MELNELDVSKVKTEEEHRLDIMIKKKLAGNNSIKNKRDSIMNKPKEREKEIMKKIEMPKGEESLFEDDRTPKDYNFDLENE